MNTASNFRDDFSAAFTFTFGKKYTQIDTNRSHILVKYLPRRRSFYVGGSDSELFL